MVMETRKIILSKGELAMALNAYRTVDPAYLPGGKVISCYMPNESEVAIDLEIYEAEAPRFHLARVMALTRITLLPARLVEPLINFCIEHSVMLPRRGKKSAVVSEGIPALYIELETQPVLDFEG